MSWQSIKNNPPKSGEEFVVRRKYRGTSSYRNEILPKEVSIIFADDGELVEHLLGENWSEWKSLGEDDRSELYLTAQKGILEDLLQSIKDDNLDTESSIKGAIQSHLDVIMQIKTRKESVDD